MPRVRVPLVDPIQFRHLRPESEQGFTCARTDEASRQTSLRSATGTPHRRGSTIAHDRLAACTPSLRVRGSSDPQSPWHGTARFRATDLARCIDVVISTFTASPRRRSGWHTRWSACRCAKCSRSSGPNQLFVHLSELVPTRELCLHGRDVPKGLAHVRRCNCGRASVARRGLNSPMQVFISASGLHAKHPDTYTEQVDIRRPRENWHVADVQK